jgi:hypothetical protein
MQTTSTPQIGDEVTILNTDRTHVSGYPFAGGGLAMLGIVNRERGSIPARIRVIDTSTFDPGHEFAGQVRVIVRWTGTDSSGHFDEYRDAVTLASNVQPAA